MALFDFLKKRKKEKEEKIKKEKPVKKEVKEIQREPVSKVKTEKKAPKRPLRKSKVAYKVLKGPHITEKTTELAGNNQYTFLIYSRTNKNEIKKAVEDLYSVEVTGVNIVRIPPKRRRLGRTPGWKKGYKKAIVRIKEGQKIDIFPK
jgi:large subunit ribosomal protein L23